MRSAISFTAILIQFQIHFLFPLIILFFSSGEILFISFSFLECYKQHKGSACSHILSMNVKVCDTHSTGQIFFADLKTLVI
jgi:hypothetical protein